jgi:HTH-type transcriptional regulator/antitoxin HipB
MICAITQMAGPRGIEEIARFVREERRRQGLNQEALALVANVAVRSVHRIEHAEETVRLDTLLRVLAALGVDLTIRRRGER